jgi:hypothetical protein
MRQMTQQDIRDIQAHFPIEACLRPPDLDISEQAASSFAELFSDAQARGPAAEIPYNLPYPRYLFLEYLANQYGLMMHGSTNRELDLLKPVRLSTDSREFGNQAAIYATQDPLWALFFAVLDRNAITGSINNGAIQLKGDDGSVLRRYFFTVEAESLKKFPWIPGVIYILPRLNAEPDPDHANVRYGKYTLEVSHWLYRDEVQPFAKLLVEPHDFPFVNSIWGYAAEEYRRRMDAASLAGWPFLEDPELYPIMPDEKFRRG